MKKINKQQLRKIIMQGWDYVSFDVGENLGAEIVNSNGLDHVIELTQS